MTHALQVLHTLQWHHPGGRALLQLAQAPTQDYHSYTHTLLGVVEEHVVGPSDPPVKRTREHSAAKQGLEGRGALFACTAQMSMKSDSLLCHRQRRSYLFV